MQEKKEFSPTSMTFLNTTLIEYFKLCLAGKFGDAEADQIIDAEYRFMSRMDEGKESETELDIAVDYVIHPLLGLCHGI